MKKILACLVIIGCLAMVFSLPASAAGSKEVDVIVDVVNEEVTVSINTNFVCGGLQGVLKYDSSNIEYEDLNIADVIAENNTDETTVSNIEGQTKLAFVGDVSNGTQGKWAELTYMVEDKNPVLFDFSSIKIYDKNGAKVSDAQISVVMRGDTNVDGLIDMKDIVRMKKISANVLEIAKGKAKNLDMDGSGDFEDAVDLTCLRTYLLNK